MGNDFVSCRRRAVAAVLGVIALIVAAGCTGSEPVGMADYPVYTSSAELIDKADLVVRGVALSSRAGELLPDVTTGSDPLTNPQAGLSSAEAETETETAGESAAIAVTITTVRLDEVFKGPGAPGDLIEVSQLAKDEGTVVLSPAAKGGYVLFLASYGPGKPHALLNPDAFYTVGDGGALTPIGPGTPPLASVDELRRG